MKVARFVLKIVAASLAGAALVCAIIGYWDKISQLFSRLGGQDPRVEYDDYADWEE